MEGRFFFWSGNRRFKNSFFLLSFLPSFLFFFDFSSFLFLLFSLFLSFFCLFLSPNFFLLSFIPLFLSFFSFCCSNTMETLKKEKKTDSCHSQDFFENPFWLEKELANCLAVVGMREREKNETRSK